MNKSKEFFDAIEAVWNTPTQVYRTEKGKVYLIQYIVKKQLWKILL